MTLLSTIPTAAELAACDAVGALRVLADEESTRPAEWRWAEVRRVTAELAAALGLSPLDTG